MSWIFIDTITTFVLSVALVAVLRRLTVALALVDRPDSVRKRHKGVIPLCGGMAIFIAFASVVLFGRAPSVLGLDFWLGLAVIIIVGVVDDRHPLPAVARLLAQLGAAVLIVGGMQIGSLSIGVFFATNAVLMTPFFFVIGIIFVTGLVNAWNMLDGIDGLGGGCAAVALAWLIVIASFGSLPDIIPPLETLLVAVCAFLVFNMRSPWRQRASIFLGDAGSTALGMTIAYAVLLIATQSTAVSFPALLWVVIVPVADTLSLMVRRFAAGRSPMSADRWHMHHLLLDHGLSTAAATNTLIIASAICGAIGYLGIRAQVPGEIMAISLVVPIALHTAFMLVATGYVTRRALPAKGRSIETEPETFGGAAADAEA